jgi:hypothetical protein
MRAEGWIEHDGGECPVPLDSAPHIKFRNGGHPVQSVVTANAWEWEWEPADASDWDIIAYRIEGKQP